MDQSTSQIQEKLNSTVENMSNKLNSDIDACFNQNMEDPEGFSQCMMESMKKYEEFGKKLELFNMFGQKYALNANAMNQDQQTTSERLTNIMQTAIEKLTRKYE